MIQCPNCGTGLEDDSRFCIACGVPISAPECCRLCGEPVNREFAFCQKCGAPAGAAAQEAPAPQCAPEAQPAQAPQYAPAAPQYATAGAPAGAQQEQSGAYPYMGSAYGAPAPYAPAPAKKGLSMKLVGIILGGVALAGIVVFVLFNFVLGQGGAKSILFIKDGEINFTYTAKVDPFEVTSKLASAGSIDEYAGYTYGYRTKISKNGKNIFYPDRQTSGQYGFTLYYKELSGAKKNPEGTKISADVMNYEINSAGNKVYYLKGSGGGLYYSNLKESEKLDSDVQIFWVDDTGNKLIYSTKDGDIYQKTQNKDKVKIDSDAQVYHVSDDLSKVYYLKGESLYLKADGKDKEKVASGVGDFVTVYETGELYYIKAESSDRPLIDYVDDYLKDSDEAIVRPELEGYASWEDYYLDYAEYQKKLNRDQLRNSLKTATVSIAEKTLYYYDGTNTVVVATGLSDVLSYSWEKPVMVYGKYNREEIPLLKIDEINYSSQVQQMVYAALTSSSDVFAAVKAAESFIEQSEAFNYTINHSGTAIYFLDDYSGSTGDLYEAKISGTTVAAPTRYAEDIYSFYRLAWETDNLLTFQDVNTGRETGDLYLNNKLVDTDVYVYGVEAIEGTANLVYYVDWSSSRHQGTLKVYDGKNAAKIADDVHDVLVLDVKTIAYLVDYNTSRARGDAYLYNGSSKPQKIADDVTAFLRIY